MEVPGQLQRVEVAQIRGWLNNLRNAVLSNRIRGDESNILVKRTATGSTISLKKKNLMRKLV